MKTSQARLAVSAKDWDASVRHLTASLDRFNVPAREKDDVPGAIGGLNKDIVGKA